MAIHTSGPPGLSRRAALRLLGGGAAAASLGWPGGEAAADAARNGTEFFLLIHAAGGWDVTLWSDPRNERKGIIQPASSENTDHGPLRRWVDQPLDDGTKTFKIVQPAGSRIPFGPGIGDLADHFAELTVINGLAMNTVSHPDGSNFSASGRHLVGNRAPASSIDTALANEFGREQTFPLVSVQFPSSYVGDNLDRRVVPLIVGEIGTITRSLTRSKLYDTDDDRQLVTEMLVKESRDLARKAAYPDVLAGMGLQYESLLHMLRGNVQDIFSADALRRAQPDFNYRGRFAGPRAVNAAFAIEAMKRDVVRCVSFAVGGFDTHQTNYRTHGQLQQELFDMLATFLKQIHQTPHPSLSGKKLADHTHILVVSDFCRTPQVNRSGGRDHYPNNSALVISPKFRGNMVFGQADAEQLLPVATREFAGHRRPIAPPDLLATFLSAFGVNPRKYLRDGEVVAELLRA
jgi:hypothetical protein